MERWIPSHRAKPLTLFLAVAFLLFFRPRWAFVPWNNGFDDTCYLTILSNFIKANYDNCRSTFAPGISLLWIPAGLAAKAAASFGWGTYPELASIFIGLYTFFLWAIGLFLLDQFFQCQTHSPSVVKTILVFLNIPVLYYATQRTHLAHVGEIVLALATVLALWRQRIEWATLFASALCITRFNDLPIFLMIFGSVLDQRRSVKRLMRFPAVLLFASFAILSLSIYHVAAIKGYQGKLIIPTRFAIEKHKLIETFFSSHWGLLWSATWWLFCLALAVVRFQSISWTSRAALTWMILMLWLYQGWFGHGGDFAYRYLIGSYAAALWIWCERMPYESMPLKKWSDRIICGSALWLTYLFWIYRTPPRLSIFFQIQAIDRLLHPLSLLPPAGLSAPGFLVFSLFHDSTLFSSLSAWSNTALVGARLFCLALSTTIAFAIAVYLIFSGISQGTKNEFPEI